MRKLHFKILLLIILLILSSIIVSSQLTFNSIKASHEGEKRGLRLEEECLAKKKKDHTLVIKQNYQMYERSASHHCHVTHVITRVIFDRVLGIVRDRESNGAKRGQAALESSNRRVKRVALKVKRFVIIVSLART